MFRRSRTQHFFIINIIIWLGFLLSLRLFQLGDSPQQLQSWCYLGIALLAAQGIAFALRKNILAGIGYYISAILLLVAYFHAWRSLNNIQADQLITSMPITQ